MRRKAFLFNPAPHANLHHLAGHSRNRVCKGICRVLHAGLITSSAGWGADEAGICLGGGADSLSSFSDAEDDSPPDSAWYSSGKGQSNHVRLHGVQTGRVWCERG